METLQYNNTSITIK